MVLIGRAATWLSSRRGAVLGLAIGWALLIAAGAGSRPEATRWIGIPPVRTAIITLAMVAAFVTLMLLIVASFHRAGEGQEQDLPARKPLWPLLIVGLLFVILIVLRSPRDDVDEVDQRSVAESVDPKLVGRGDAALSWTELLVLLGLVGGAGAAVAWNGRRVTQQRATSDEPVPKVEGIEPVMSRTADRLRLGDDPRSAVLLAYAELERGLAGLGHPRGPSETPSEHTARALAALITAEAIVETNAVIDLARLYELARFAERTITEGDRRQAVTALERVEAALSFHS